jgi:hypothetical protein
MKTAALIREAKKRYPFLKDTFIEIDQESPAYGTGNTAYTPPALEGGGSITIVVAELRDKFAHERARFERRFGKFRTFEQFVLLTFLHEIAHARQFSEGNHRALHIAYRTVVDTKTHDKNVVEVAADEWARQESKKW